MKVKAARPHNIAGLVESFAKFGKPMGLCIVLDCPRAEHPTFIGKRSYCAACKTPFEITSEMFEKILDTSTIETTTPNDGIPTIGKLVRRLRKAKGLIQGQLAANMHTQRTYIVKLENGNAVPKLEQYERIAKGLGMETSEFMWLATQPTRDWQLITDPVVAGFIPYVLGMSRTAMCIIATQLSYAEKHSGVGPWLRSLIETL